MYHNLVRSRLQIRLSVTDQDETRSAGSCADIQGITAPSAKKRFLRRSEPRRKRMTSPGKRISVGTQRVTPTSETARYATVSFGLPPCTRASRQVRHPPVRTTTRRASPPFSSKSFFTSSSSSIRSCVMFSSSRTVMTTGHPAWRPHPPEGPSRRRCVCRKKLLFLRAVGHENHSPNDT